MGNIVESDELRPPLRNLVDVFGAKIESVSYTHLDVYKRQPQDRMQHGGVKSPLLRLGADTG